LRIEEEGLRIEAVLTAFCSSSILNPQFSIPIL